MENDPDSRVQRESLKKAGCVRLAFLVHPWKRPSAMMVSFFLRPVEGTGETVQISKKLDVRSRFHKI